VTRTPAPSTIDYGNLMHRAMRGLIQEVLVNVAKDGLPGEHHFFITFDTMHPDVEIADWLSDRYPGDMTVVIQHWFDNLEVQRPRCKKWSSLNRTKNPQNAKRPMLSASINFANNAIATCRSRYCGLIGIQQHT